MERLHSHKTRREKKSPGLDGGAPQLRRARNVYARISQHELQALAVSQCRRRVGGPRPALHDEKRNVDQ